MIVIIPRFALDQSSAFELVDYKGHAGTLHAEHDGKRLIRHRDLFCGQPILAHEQPAGHAMLQLAGRVDHCRQGCLDQEHLHVAKEHHPDAGYSIAFLRSGLLMRCAASTLRAIIEENLSRKLRLSRFLTANRTFTTM